MTGGDGTVADPNWQPIVSGSRTFTVSQARTNWNDAEDACARDLGAGAQLATFLAEEEWIDVLMSLNTTAHEAFGLWVGYTSSNREGDWASYITSYPMLPFVQWLPGSPLSANNYVCAEIRRRDGTIGLSNYDCASEALPLRSLCVQDTAIGSSHTSIYSTMLSSRPDGRGAVYSGSTSPESGAGASNGGAGAVATSAVYNYDVPYGMWTSWTQAVDVCIMEYGPAASLAWFETEQQFTEVATQLKNLNILRPDGVGVWIGYSNNSTGSQWMSRAIGAPLPSFLPWEVGRPGPSSFGGQHCAYLMLSVADNSSTVANDVACNTVTTTRPGLCMWSARPNPHSEVEAARSVSLKSLLKRVVASPHCRLTWVWRCRRSFCTAASANSTRCVGILPHLKYPQLAGCQGRGGANPGRALGHL